MYGVVIGAVSVVLSQRDASTKSLWSSQENFGDQWRYGHVTVKSSTDFQIGVEGVVGSSYLGFVLWFFSIIDKGKIVVNRYSTIFNKKTLLLIFKKN